MVREYMHEFQIAQSFIQTNINLLKQIIPLMEHFPKEDRAILVMKIMEPLFNLSKQ